MKTKSRQIYTLPAFLEGRCTQAIYTKWLNNKAWILLKRDKKRRKPYAASATRRTYKQLIHQAIVEAGEYDPFTGDALAWELIGTWDTSHEQPEGYKKQFALMPTVDHIDSDLLEFEICSSQSNDCKSDLNPAEFVAYCKRVAQYRKTDAYIKKWMSLKRGGPKDKAKYYA
jgi:hypothetical protein